MFNQGQMKRRTELVRCSEQLLKEQPSDAVVQLMHRVVLELKESQINMVATAPAAPKRDGRRRKGSDARVARNEKIQEHAL